LNEEDDELSNDIADAIKVKAIELVKKEIENAKQSDDVEDEIHNVKQEVSGSPEDGQEAQGQEGGSVGAPADDPSASGAVAATSNDPNQVPADQAPEQGAQDPSTGQAQDHQTEAPATDAEGGTSDGSAAAATQTPPAEGEQKSEENKEDKDAFGIGEDYLDLYPRSFHLGHKLNTPSFRSNMFGKILTESSKQFISSTGKLDAEKALGNATTLFCIYECLESFGLLNENNYEKIFNKLVY